MRRFRQVRIFISSICLEKLHACSISFFRYLKRLARHGVIRKDPLFRAFIQEKESPKELKSGNSLSEMLAGFKETLSNIGSVLFLHIE